MIEKYLITILFLLVFSSGKHVTNIIVLPFKTYRERYNHLKPLNISSIVNNHIYTEIEISNQTLVASFKSDEYGFYMTDQNCIEKSNYKIINSKTFMPLTSFNNTEEGFASETMVLYRDINLKMKRNGLYTRMRITSYNKERQCAIFGLKMKSDVYEFIQSFIKTFKENTNIKYYKWTLKYNSNDEGLLVLGDNPVEYDPIFKKKNYTEYRAKAIIYKTYPHFGLKFDEVTINNTKLNVNKEVQFCHDLGVISVDQRYYENITDIFFTQYFSNNICEKLWEYGKYGYVRCNGKNFTDKDINSFPTIFFKHIEMNYVFELNYKDLFSKEEDGNIYFLIVFDLTHDGIKFGKPFLKKYPFTIDTDLYTISLFIKENKGKSNKTLVIIFIIVSILFVAILSLLIVYGYKLKKGKNKKRANELDEDYEYEPGKNNNDGLINQ